MDDTMQNSNKYLYRIYSFDFKEDGFINNLVIQDLATKVTRKAKLERLLSDAEVLQQFKLQDVITIAYMAGQQEVLKEQAWLKELQEK